MPIALSIGKRKINNNLKPLCKFIKKNINEHINKVYYNKSKYPY